MDETLSLRDDLRYYSDALAHEIQHGTDADVALYWHQRFTQAANEARKARWGDEALTLPVRPRAAAPTPKF